LVGSSSSRTENSGVTIAPRSAAAVVPPSVDPFYVAPANLASFAPGSVLRSRQVTIVVCQRQ